MCGIVGYIGKNKASEILISGLKRLEYRGYDSAGICTIEGSSLVTTKCKGKVSKLQSKLNILYIQVILVLVILAGLLMESLIKKMPILIQTQKKDSV